MPEMEMRSTLQIAQKLVDRFPEETRNELKSLLLQAAIEENPVVKMEISDLLMTNENVLLWMQEQLELYEEQENVRSEYQGMPGGHGPVPARWKWSCPTAGCLRSWPVIQEGEDAPLCEVHGCRMVRGDQAKG